ncbi:hypothetical protein OKJ48_10640 [Streptomyces kunmingensis]|uniref:Uncharacterized protein n=1 Tax=Streptomyces kunmingensis TaxID=68225 RepID=A0ABU6C885_9ACTN|nr:hypothetical protein [Streptomyces kunmingensis]MEB3960694.1 hypothetical protein [Streptomyces kunmingensis]
MLKKIEALGAGLLERLVPGVDAAACGWKHWENCWQCGGRPCSVNTCNADLICG